MNTPIVRISTPRPISLPIREIELLAWLTQAEPGERLEYHRGYLGIDRAGVGQPMTFADRRHLSGLAKQAMRLAEQDLVHLVQRRLGPDEFSYLAIARPRPAGAVLSYSNLLTQEAA